MILTVDDDIAMRTLVSASLEQAGFKVEEAENGVVALEAFKRVHPDIVLTDVKMPVMDGFEFCQQLRQQAGGADVPVVFITGLDDVWSIQHAYEVGGTDFITKPIDWLILSHRVRYILRASAAFQALRGSERKLAQAQSIAKIGHWEWNLQTRRSECADETLRIFGLTAQAQSDFYSAMLERIHPDDQARVREVIQQALSGSGELDVDYRIVVADQGEKAIHSRGRVSFDEDHRAVKLWGMVQDITERKQAEERIRFLAYYDSLTGLPNRFLFEEKAQQLLQSARRFGGKFAILHLDVDRFTRINETLGHNAGDVLLKTIARLLGDAVRSADPLARLPGQTEDGALVARFGGDEFTVLLTRIAQPEDTARIARGILAELARPLRIGEQEILVSVSIGGAVYPENGWDADTVLKNANSALARAKKAGGNVFQVYADSMNTRALERLNLEAQLKQAIEHAELALYYQPQIDIQSGAIVGMEALCRWPHPARGFISPAEFIPLAEESGLILPLGEWALHTACAQAKAWQDAGHPPLCMAVNLSGRQFRQPGLIQQVLRSLGATRLDARFLELEITESVVMDSVTESIATLKKLKDMGVSLAIDDFGTGYSSLSYLKRFPVDKLKVDQSFVREVVKGSADAAIASVIIDLAHSLNLQAIAEGVETEQQLAFLRDRRCDQCQGYFFSKPAPPDEIQALLTTTFAPPDSPAPPGG